MMNRAKIEDVLLKMGMPAGILGFNYIADAVEYIDENGTDISVTKELYPDIAKKRNTTASRVERAIRHAFERVRSYGGNPDMVDYCIGMNNCESYNTLSMLHIRIKQECTDEDIERKGDVLAEEEKITALEVREIIREELNIFLSELNGVST